MSLLTSPIAAGDSMVVGATKRAVTAVGAATPDASSTNNTYAVTMGANAITPVASSIVLSEDPFDASKGNTYIFSGTTRVPFNG